MTMPPLPLCWRRTLWSTIRRIASRSGGETGRRNTSGLISYSSYVRSVEYAGMLGEMVLLMGDERVVPKGDSPMAGKEVRRRFTDVGKMEGGHWVLTARQAT